jgi:hypothetical protein
MPLPKFDPEKRLEELFWKHMDLSPNRPQCQPNLDTVAWLARNESEKAKDNYIQERKQSRNQVNPEEFHEQFEYNFEYIEWYWSEEKALIRAKYWCKGSDRGTPRLLGAFYGQEAKLALIEEEFTEYAREHCSRFLSILNETIAQMKSLNVPVGEIEIPQMYSKFMNYLWYLGLPVEYTENDDNKIIVYSPPQYGKFLQFEIV